MRAALAERDVAGVYRRLQSAGVSQRRIAALTGQSQSEISEILAGRRVTNYEVLVRVADGLGVPRGWMGLAHVDSTAPGNDVDAGRASAAPGAVEPSEPAQPSEAVEPGRSVTSDCCTGSGRVAARAADAFLPAVAAGLAIAMFPTHRSDAEPLTVAVLSENVRQAWLVRQQARYATLGQILTALIPAVDHAVAAGTKEREQAQRVGVHTYNLASALLKKLGDYPQAMVAADRALTAARGQDDDLLVAAAAFRLANVLLPATRFAEARRVAIDAASSMSPTHRTKPRGLAVWGGLLLTAALAAARDGDQPGAWEILGEARAVSRILGTDHADIYAIFGPTNVAIHTVQLAVEGGDGAGAIKRGKEVKVDNLPDSLLERRAQFLIDLARAHTMQDEHRAAVGILLQAERKAPQEVRMNHDVRHTIDVLLARAQRPIPELRKLAQRIDDTNEREA